MICAVLLLFGAVLGAEPSPAEAPITSFFVASQRIAVRSQPSPFGRTVGEIAPRARTEAGKLVKNKHGEWRQVALRVGAHASGRRRRAPPLIWGWIPTAHLVNADTHREALYTSNYGRRETQREMVLDDARTAAYGRAIDAHAHLFNGATVLDVGCGSAILSLFAARAGAARVLCVEKSAHAVELARAVKAANRPLSDVIEIIVADLDDYLEGGDLEGGDLGNLSPPPPPSQRIKLPRVDIIISEWMGYVGLVEGMLSTVIAARDRFLVRGGTLFPDYFTLRVAGARAEAVPRPLRDVMEEEDNALLAERSLRYAFDLRALGAAATTAPDGSRQQVPPAAARQRKNATVMQQPTFKPLYVTEISLADVCTASAVVFSIDLATIASSDVIMPMAAGPNSSSAEQSSSTSASSFASKKTDATASAHRSARGRLRRRGGNVTLLNRVEGSCNVRSLALWWSVLFRGEPFVGGAACSKTEEHERPPAVVAELDTSPWSASTHWKQAVLALARSKLDDDTLLRGRIELGPDPRDSWGRSFALGVRMEGAKEEALYRIPSAFDAV